MPWPRAKCHVCLHVAAVDKQKHFDIDINQRLCGCKIKVLENGGWFRGMVMRLDGVVKCLEGVLQDGNKEFATT